MTLLSEAPATTESTPTVLPVAIIGAGPIGLAAAANLLERGIEPLVLEQGDRAGAAIAQWGHVRLFSPWKHLVEPASTRLLEATGWTLPSPESAPTGRELVEEYLQPLASILGTRIRYGARVDGVSRFGMDRTRTIGREDAPFLLRLTDGQEIHARAVIDASGTLATPNPVTASGLPLRDAAAVAGRIAPALPEVLGRDRAQHAGRHTVVVGAGHSAATTLIALARLADDAPGTTATWLIRTAAPSRVYGSDADELTGRASLGAAVRALVERGRIDLVDRFSVTDVAADGDGIAIQGVRLGERSDLHADTLVVATGFRPDLDLLREIRFAVDDIVEAPVKLAPLIDPNLHSCGTVPPHGVDELSHPELGFWLAGMKSYGRAPTFLLLTGYEQVRSIADELAGNHDDARRIDLVLPATGVCSTDAPATTSCCTSDAAPLPTPVPVALQLTVLDVEAANCCQ